MSAGADETRFGVVKPLKSKRPKESAARPFGPEAEHRLHLARAALFYEALWPRAWPLIGLILIFLGLAWFDAWRLVRTERGM